MRFASEKPSNGYRRHAAAGVVSRNSDRIAYTASIFTVLAALLAGSSAQAQTNAAVEPPSATAVPSLVLDAATRKTIVDTVAAALVNGYAHADIGQRMAQAVEAKLDSGRYDNLVSGYDFARALTEDVRSVNNDKHLRIWFAPPSANGTGMMPSREAMMAMMRAMNGAIPRIEILEGNIGYMEVNGLAPLAAAKETIAAAFAFLHNTDALIIDARGNGGGDPETVAYYMSYLSEGAPHVVNSFHWRQDNRVDETKTTDLAGLTYGATKPVFYLTSHRTFSGGEEFAYDVQAFRRGTIVGETTGGGANPSDIKPLGHGFIMQLPDGYVVNPVTGTNWEGVGVKPDIDVPASEAMNVAHRLAVDRLKALTTDPSQLVAFESLSAQLDARDDGAGPVMRGNAHVQAHVRRDHVSFSQDHLNAARLVGVYKGAGLGMSPGGALPPSVVERNGALYIDLNTPNTPEVRLMPLGGDHYHLDGYPDDFTATFNTTADGKVQLVVYQSRWPAGILRKQ